MNRLLLTLLCIVMVFFLCSCYGKNDIASESIAVQQAEQTDPSPIPEKQPVTSREASEARLIVNGVDITEGNHIFIHHEEQNAEIPILAIMRALGYDVNVRYQSSSGTYEAVIDDYVFLTTHRTDFSIPPESGSESCVRRFAEDEFIIDSQCIFTLLYWEWGAEINIDYDESTVYVDSIDLYSKAETNPPFPDNRSH